MQNRRSPPSEITPQFEDMGLFKNEVGEFAVALVPLISRSSRSDLVVRGFINQNIAIAVVFAGRRSKETAALERRIRALFIQASRAAAAAKLPAPAADSIRLPVRIEGAWRARFQRDATGWETRTHQLLVARWGFVDRDGITNLGGRPSVV